MPATALAFALGAAFLHAFWNLLLARTRDIEAATAVALLVALAAFAPVTVLVWRLDHRVWPFIAVTSLLQVVYFLLLTSAYNRAEMSFVYPIARGAAPVVVLLAGVVLLGNGVSAVQTLGVSVVALGVLLVRGIGGSGSGRDLALAVALASCIASYTLLDKHGIRYAAPIVYLELSSIPPCLCLLGVALARSGRTALRAAMRPVNAAAGMATFGAYALVLAALARAPAPSVAAVRETSVVIAVALAAPLLGERVGWARLAGAALVVVGVALLGIR
jgi:drug/metabolite transporter (DMT)-like permease